MCRLKSKFKKHECTGSIVLILQSEVAIYYSCLSSLTLWVVFFFLSLLSGKSSVHTLLGVLVCSGCYNKIPQIWYLLSNRNLGSGALKSEIKVPACLIGALLGVADFSLYLYMVQVAGNLYGASYKNTDSIK